MSVHCKTFEPKDDRITEPAKYILEIENNILQELTSCKNDQNCLDSITKQATLCHACLLEHPSEPKKCVIDAKGAGLSTGAKVGIGLGVPLAAAIVGVCIWVGVRKRSQ